MTVFCMVELDGGTVIDASLRALSLARGLAAGADDGPVLAAVVFGDPPVAELAAYGVTDVYVISGIDGYAPVAWARAIAGLLGSVPHAVAAAGTDRGNEVLAHLGAITGQPMAANCTGAVDNGGALAITRQRWAGLLIEEAVLEAPVALLTVATDAVSPVPADEPTTVAVHAVAPTFAEDDLAMRAV